MRRAVWASAQWLVRTRGTRCWFVTLTYRDLGGWRPRHISDFLRCLRAWCAKHECKARYIWVAELQQRGAVHYHLALWLPRRLVVPFPDRAGWWPHGMTQRAEAQAPIGYLMKYVSKGDTPMHTFPAGAHIYGTGGLCRDGKEMRAWVNLPEWAKRMHGVGELARVGGSVVVRATGEILTSPWQVLRTPGGMLLRLLRELPAKFHDGPYCSYPRAIACGSDP